MKFIETKIKGVWIIDLEKIEDSRGFFARSFCQNEFEAHNLKSNFVQCNISGNSLKGTIRGMHLQKKPHEEAKLIRCIKGKIFDVALDLRENSDTYKSWVSVELSADNARSIYIPEGCAHGFQTLTDDATLHYQMTEFYYPESTTGVSYDSNDYNIDWPLQITNVSKQDSQ